MDFPNFQRIIIKEFKQVFVDISKIFISSNKSIKEKCRELITTFIFNELSHPKELNEEKVLIFTLRIHSITVSLKYSIHKK